MRLRKVEWHDTPFYRPSPGSVGAPGRAGETRIVREVVEKPVDITEYLEPIHKEIDKLKRKKPEFVGGVGATGSYHKVTEAFARFQKTSFNPGINIIGVASSKLTSIYLPNDLDTNHIIVIKDELGLASQYPISVYVIE